MPQTRNEATPFVPTAGRERIKAMEELEGMTAMPPRVVARILRTAGGEGRCPAAIIVAKRIWSG